MATNNQARLDITARDLTREAFDSVARNFERLNKTAETTKRLLAGGIGIEVLRRSFDAVLDATLEFQRTQTELVATLTATGHAAGITKTELDEMAEALSKTTNFDDEGIRAAETALLRFKDVQGETFKQALKLSLDLATVQGGTAASAAEALGRALENPTQNVKQLVAAGLKLSPQQQDQIRNFVEMGDVTAADKIIMDALAKSFGGIAEASRKGLVGSVTDAKKAYDDFLKTVGKSQTFQSSASSFFNFLTQSVKDLDQILTASDISDKLKGIGLFVAGFRGFELKSAKPKEDQFKGLSEGAEQFIAAQGKAEQDRARAQDIAYQKQQQALKERATLVTAGLQKEVAAQQEAANENQQILDLYYNRGLVRTTEYYQARIRIARAANDAEIDEIGKVIDAQKALRDAPSTTQEQKPGIGAEIARLEAQRASLQEKNRFNVVKGSEELTDAFQKERDQIDEINASLLEQQGLLEQAAALRFRIQNRTFRAQVAQDRPEDSHVIDEQEEKIKAQARLNQAIVKSGILRDEEANKESEIQNKLTRGQITELEALKQTDDVRKESIDRLRQAANEQLGKALEFGDKQGIQNAKNFQQAIEDLAASADQVGAKFRNLFSDSLTDPFADFIVGAKSAEDAFKDFASNIERALARIAAQNLAESVFGAGTAGGGAADFIGKIFTSSKGNVITPHGPMQLQRFAAGGIATRPMLSLIGEGRQNEAVVPLPDGRKIPVDLKGGGGGGIYMPITIVANDPNAFRRSEGQITTAIGRAVQGAMRRA